MRTTRLLPGLAALLILSWSCLAFASNPEVKVTLKKGAVLITVPPRVHIKKSLTEVTLASKPGSLKVAPLPKADAKDELGDDIFHGQVAIPVTGEGLKGEVTLEVQYQACTEGEGGNCYPPVTVPLRVNASDIPAAITKPPATKPGQAPVPLAEPSVVQAAQPAPSAGMATVSAANAPAPAPGAERGFLLGLLVVFIAGLGASLTPCVYPMIPITMAIIGAKGGGKLKGFSLSMVLVLGMAVTYTALGVVAARSGATFGAFAQKPAFLIPVSVLFAFFALSLFGAFEIALPQGLQNRLQGGGPRKGYGGAFLMGMVLGPISAPCVGPIIGAVLVSIAQKGDVFLGGLQLFTFALGMGVLFLVVGTFSAALPRSGDWLTRFKYIMGLTVLGFAAWNVRLVVPEALNFAMWTLVLLVGSAVFGAFGAAEGLASQLRKSFAILLLLLGLLLGLRAVEGFLGVQLLPQSNAPITVQNGPKPWMEQDLEGALKKAKAENKLVLVDIYAEWCAQCKELDEKTWPDTEVKAWIAKHAVAIRIDTDKQRPDLAKKLEIRSYPSVILLDGDGKEVGRSLGFHKPDAMLAFLSAVH